MKYTSKGKVKRTVGDLTKCPECGKFTQFLQSHYQCHLEERRNANARWLNNRKISHRGVDGVWVGERRL